MTDQAFELRLQAAYDAFAEEAIVDVDATTLAAVIMRDTRSRVTVFTQTMRPRWLPWAVATLLLIAAVFAMAAVGAMLLRQQQYRGVLVPGPDMSVARQRPVVVPLADGRVLIAAGVPGWMDVEPRPEVFDPDTGTYYPLAGDAPTGSGAGVLLQDGRVLAITFDGTQSTIAAYLLDPESMTSRQLPYGTNTVSYGLMPEVALLRDGRVLIVDENLAGTDLPGPASVFDPNQEVFTSIGTPNTPRSHAAIATLADGKVLLAGGLSSGPATIYNRSDEGLTDAELYDPATGTFTLVGELPSVQGMAQGFLRKDGRVLIVQQGDSTTRFGVATMTSLALDIFDPATGTFTALEPVHLPGPPTVTHLADGRLLFTGRHQGLDGVDDEPLAAIYDPANGSTIEQQAPRAVLPEGVVTADGRVVLVGGFTNPPLTPGDPAVPWIEIGQ